MDNMVDNTNIKTRFSAGECDNQNPLWPLAQSITAGATESWLWLKPFEYNRGQGEGY